ncbi:MAG TPA: hypothetical protein VNQ90_15710 [Chthoniobacteraceae bacterium]|nr:hypothetical protein [Chthoniobacteraceae bacterium]
MKTRTILALARWVLACLLFTVTFWTEVTGLSYDKTFIPVAAVVGGCILIAPELIHWGSLPIQAFFSSLFFPSNREIPPPDYVLTGVYREQGRYDEALDQYLTIVRNHPEELLAYLEGMETAFENGTPEVAKKFHRLGLQKLKVEAAREQVERSYHLLCEAAANAPEVEEEEEADAPAVAENEGEPAFEVGPGLAASETEAPETDRFGLMPEPDPNARQVINGDDHGGEPRA